MYRLAINFRLVYIVIALCSLHLLYPHEMIGSQPCNVIVVELERQRSGCRRCFHFNHVLWMKFYLPCLSTFPKSCFGSLFTNMGLLRDKISLWILINTTVLLSMVSVRLSLCIAFLMRYKLFMFLNVIYRSVMVRYSSYVALIFQRPDL